MAWPRKADHASIGGSSTREAVAAAFLTFFDHKALKYKGSEDAGTVQPAERLVVLAKDDSDMQFTLKFLPRPKLGRGFLFLGALYGSLAGSAAQAQNIDEGKSAPRLFADSCVTCHRSANGLAKGRYRPTLFMFLKDHYTTSSGAAWELASYLASVDTPQRGRSRTAASRSTSGAHRPRPPAPVPTAQ